MCLHHSFYAVFSFCLWIQCAQMNIFCNYIVQPKVDESEVKRDEWIVWNPLALTHIYNFKIYNTFLILELKQYYIICSQLSLSLCLTLFLPFYPNSRLYLFEHFFQIGLQRMLLLLSRCMRVCAHAYGHILKRQRIHALTIMIFPLRRHAFTMHMPCHVLSFSHVVRIGTHEMPRITTIRAARHRVFMNEIHFSWGYWIRSCFASKYMRRGLFIKI